MTTTPEEAARAWLLEAVAFNEQRIPKSDIASLAALIREREAAVIADKYSISGVAAQVRDAIRALKDTPK